MKRILLIGTIGLLFVCCCSSVVRASAYYYNSSNYNVVVTVREHIVSTSEFDVGANWLSDNDFTVTIGPGCSYDAYDYVCTDPTGLAQEEHYFQIEAEETQGPAYEDRWDDWTSRDEWDSRQYGGTNWDGKSYGAVSWNDKNYGSPSWGDKEFGSTDWGSKNYGAENWNAWSYSDDWGDWSDTTSRSYTNYSDWTPDASGVPSNQTLTQTRTADFADTTKSSRSGTRTGTRSGTIDWTMSGTRAWSRSGSVDWTRSGSVEWTQSGTMPWTQAGTRYWEHTGVRTWSDGHTESLYESSSEPLSDSGVESTSQSGADPVSDSGSESISESGTDSVSDSGTESLADSSSTPIEDSKESVSNGSETETRIVQGTGPIPVSASIAATATNGTYPFSTTISWNTTDATSVVVTGPGLSSVAANGSQILSGLGAGTLTYTITAQGFSGPVVRSVTVVVGKAPLTVAANNKSRTYGQPNPVLDATISGFVNGDSIAVVSGAPALACGATASSGAGTYSITVGVGTLNAANYSFGLFSNGVLAVTKAPLTASADNKSRSYGAANPALTISYTGFVNGDAATTITPPTLTTAAIATSAVGIYPITLSGGAAVNYSLTLVGGTLSVTRAPLTVAAANVSKTYGEANPTLAYSLSGFANGDTSAVVSGAANVSTSATNASGVGTYPTIATVGTLSAANYVFSNFVDGTLTVTKAPLTATANNQSRTYGAANPAFSINYSGFVNGDTSNSISSPVVSTPATPASPVGSYPITLSGGAAANYAMVFADGTLTITKATLSVTANNHVRTYGGANPALDYTLNGFVNGDTASVVTGAAAVSTSASVASPVGSYAIIPAVGTLAAINYTFGAFNNGTMVIAKAPLTVTADNKSRAYGAPNPTFSVSYAGFVNGDSASTITPPVVGTIATAASSVGVYPITLTGGTATNYVLSLANGSLTVTKAMLMVTADDKTRNYGSSNPALTCTYSGFVNGDSVSNLTGTPAITTIASPASNVGNYSIAVAAGLLASTNYQFTFANGTLTIAPKPVTFIFTNLSATYDGAPKTASVTPSDPSATYLSDLTKGPAAGTYVVTTTATGNYAGSGSGTLTIDPKLVTFTFGNLAHVYDGAAKSGTAIASDPDATYTSDLTKGPNAGTYLVSANATGNYTGSATANLAIARAPQTIALTPTTVTAFAGETKLFTATGGQNAYVWGGNAGAGGSSGNQPITLTNVGSYTITVSNAGSANYEPSNTVTAAIDIVSNHQVGSLTPIASSYTINDANSPMNGQTYGRIWQQGGWIAYLGRSGVRFNVKAQAWPSVKTIEVQSKIPGGTWTQLANQTPSAASTSADVTFSVMLGAAAPGQPLVPASFLDGNPQTGQWLFRARVQDANGEWSEFSPEVPVQVILPVTTKVVSGQTVPPAGALGDWFTASPIQNFSFPLWIP